MNTFHTKTEVAVLTISAERILTSERRNLNPEKAVIVNKYYKKYHYYK